MAIYRAERRLAAIMVADVVGYSRLMGRDDAGTLARLTACLRELLEPLVSEHRGRIINFPGDNALCEFASIVDAVECAVAIQRGIAERERDVPEPLRFRIGVNLGDVVAEQGDVYGDGVNIAARLEQLCEPGGVAISGTACDHVQGKFELPLEFMGEQHVKNIDRPVRVYQWRSGVLRPQPPAKREPHPWRKATEVLARALHGSMAWLRAGDTGPGARPPLPDQPSIAVLPFANMSGDPAQDYLGEGLTEDIITQLARNKNLFIIARNSTFIYAGRAVDLRQVGHDLGVRYVLEGSVRRGGDTLRVTAQLVEAENGHHVWAQTYDRAAADLFAVQDEITQSIVGELLPHLRKAETEAAFRRPTHDLRAYHLLRQGIEHHYIFTREHNLKARELFRKATELSPGYAEAYAYRAFANYIDYIYELSGPARNEALTEGLVLLGKAQRADPSCPVIYQALSQIYMAQGRFDEMLAAAETALKLGPSDAENWIIQADALGVLGRYEEGIAAAERALRLNPLAPPYYAGILAYQLYAAERYAEAVRILTPSTECNPSQPSCTIFLALSLLHLGRIDEAKPALARCAQDFPNLKLRNYLAPGAYADQTQPPKIWADLRQLGVTETPPGL
jgi:adenylate cyclase